MCVTGIAQNAGTSNIGITGFGKAGGAGNDRGGVFTLSDSEFETYSPMINIEHTMFRMSIKPNS